MPFASTNRVALRQSKETVFGVINTSPVFTDTRFTGESLNYNLSNVVSEEIRSDRMTSDLVQVQSDASGDLNIELSYDSYDDFLEGAFASTFGTDIGISAANDIATTAPNLIISTTTDFVASGIVVGQWIKRTGAVAGNNNGYFRVTAVSANQITTNVSTITTEGVAASSDITGSMIRNGTTLSSFTVQKHLQDATTPAFINFFGSRVGGQSLNFSSGQILTGSFSFMALGAVVNAAQEAGATINPASTTGVMNAVTNVVNILEDDVASTSTFSSLTMNVNNGLRAQDGIGSLPHVGIALSRLEVSGDISLYFEDATAYNKYLNATAFSLSFRLQDAAGNAYIYTLPNVKFESGSVTAGGLDQDVMLDGSWRAILDPTTNCMIQLDKFAA